MKQPIRNINKKPESYDKISKTSSDELDGSGLETYFRTQVLEKLKIKYVQQFNAKEIGRFYDFYLPEHNVLIEIHGGYWHCDKRIYESPINGIQKKNKRVDELKELWALENGFVLLIFWEKDIKQTTNKIITSLKKRLRL